MSEDEIDDIDKAILYNLQEDGRRAVTDIASDIGVSDNTVRNRMQEMEESGVISGYHVDVNYDEAGVQHYYMFVCSARVSNREKLADAVRQLPGVVSVITLMTGSHNVHIVAAGEQKDAITDLAYEVDNLGLNIEREFLIRNHVNQPYSGFRPPEYMSQE